MLSFNTGRKLPNSEREIQVGDVLVSKQTIPVVVMISPKDGTYIVKLLTSNVGEYIVISDDICFSLDEFLDAHKTSESMRVKSNINYNVSPNYADKELKEFYLPQK